MTAGGESDAVALERGYQRLLRWYPPQHRAAHGEEMLGVLLAAASEGQRRPRLAEAANLMSCFIDFPGRPWSARRALIRRDR